MESTKMFIQNKIERDVELLAALSLFAWDRAIKDVGRALPSAGKSGARVAETVKKTVLSIATNSSFFENTSTECIHHKDHTVIYNSQQSRMTG